MECFADQFTTVFFSRPIDNILLINTFDTNGTTSFFIGQAVEDGRELALQGPGELNKF